MSYKDVHIVTTSEARYASGELDTREVLFFADNFKLFATFSPEGSVELLRVNLAVSNKNESIYLPVGFMTALAAEAASYQADIQQERAHQAFIKARQSAEAMTAEPFSPAEDDRRAEQETREMRGAGMNNPHYCNGCGKLLYMSNIPQNTPNWCSEACYQKIQATREAAEQVVDLDPQRCVAVGCKEPALLRIGEFWYCAEHSKEPIPF